MNIYTVMPLLPNHITEICNDIKKQVDEGIAECPLFIMKLDPHGTPPVLNNAEEWCELYDRYNKILQKMGVPSGILIQRMMYHPNSVADTGFQDYINLSDGQNSTITCPLDKGFREYMKNTARTLALHKPSVIMQDDDFRLLTHGGGRKYGCCCPNHLNEFNKRAGTNFTREELLRAFQSEKGNSYWKLFMEIQKETLIEAAKYLRSGIDSVDPSIPVIYCTVGGEFAAEISKALAGNGNPVCCRINNSCYSQSGTHLAFPMMRAAIQIEATKGDIDFFIAETDTCPHNRYSKSARSLHAHYTGSILEGASGAKHWLTRTSGYEPGSGIAYRKILEKNSRFYKKLMEIVPTLTSLGCRIPLPENIYFDYSGNVQGWDPNKEGWARHVLEQLGLPLYFSKESGGATFLDGSRTELFSDKEISDFLSKTLFLTVDAAKKLIRRGFGKYLGVDILPFEDNYVQCELIGENRIQMQIDAEKLIPKSENTKALSYVIHVKENDKKFEIQSPAVTQYINELGGNVFVFCGVVSADNIWNVGYSFLNETRKRQLVDMLKSTCNLPVYYTGDEPVYLRTARTADGELFCGFFNVGLDYIDKISLYVEENVNEVKKLCSDGSFETCEFKYEGDNIIINTSAPTLEPVILFLSNK